MWEFVGAAHDVTVLHRGESEAQLAPYIRHVRSADAAIPVRRFPSELFDQESEIVVHMNAMAKGDGRMAVEDGRLMVVCYGRTRESTLNGNSFDPDLTKIYVR